MGRWGDPVDQHSEGPPGSPELFLAPAKGGGAPPDACRVGGATASSAASPSMLAGGRRMGAGKARSGLRGAWGACLPGGVEREKTNRANFGLGWGLGGPTGGGDNWGGPRAPLTRPSRPRRPKAPHLEGPL
jgi:hypothetical protein